MSNLFFDILESNIAVSFIFLILYAFSGKLRKRYGAVWMKSVWLLLAIRLLIPYNFSLPFAEIRLLNTPAFEQEQRNFGELFSSMQNNTIIMPETETDFETDTVTDSATEIAANTASNITVNTNNNIQSNHTGDMNDTPYFHTENQAFENNMQEENFSAAQQLSSSVNHFSYSALLTGIWMTGVCLYFLYMLISCFIFYYKCKKNIQYLEDKKEQAAHYENRSYTPLNKEILAIQKRLTGKTNIPVYQSNIISTPMLIGIFRPKLIFPVFQKTWSKTELELMTAHELCHYKNKDLFLKLIMLAACCINWFNPVVYIIKKQFFYDMELACDSQVLSNCSEKDRELYARIMLFFAGNKNKTPVFSTGFSEDKKQMKNRIDFIFDDHKKKKGISVILLICATLLTAGLLVSCGYKPQETEESGNDIPEEAGDNSDDSSPDTLEISEDTGYPDSEISEIDTAVQEFDYNNEYNTLIRCYENDVYLAQDDGIYLIKNGTEEPELLYENSYLITRGMALYRHYLYFPGSLPEEIETSNDSFSSTIYRMDLNTFEVEDIFSAFDQTFDHFFYNISIYENKLYVKNNVIYQEIGFELDENGNIIKQLDDNADDFLYKEFNDYWELEFQRINTDYDTEEYWKLTDELNEKYAALTDVASCKKMLQGAQVVSRYKDELLRSLYLEIEDGVYRYLCDIVGYPTLVTETGIYYAANEPGDIYYIDYDMAYSTDSEMKRSELFYKKDPELHQTISLVNYDADYVYLLKSNHTGFDAEDMPIYDTYLIRVSRKDGIEEIVYQFEEGFNAFGMTNRLYKHNSIYGDRMYLESDTIKVISLDPAENDI